MKTSQTKTAGIITSLLCIVIVLSGCGTASDQQRGDDVAAASGPQWGSGERPPAPPTGSEGDDHRPNRPGNGPAPGGPGGPGEHGPGQPGMGPSQPDFGTYAYLLTEDAQGTRYVSSNAGENAVRVQGNSTVLLEHISIDKTGSPASPAGDASNFYGLNAGLLAREQAQVTIESATVHTDAEGANGIFAYGDANVTLRNANIQTLGNSSGGIMVAGGASMEVVNSQISTAGDNSAALRTDRGGGVLTVDGGNYESSGHGSPAVYSTADINIANANLVANASEGVVVEGKNSVALVDTNVQGNMQGPSDVGYHNVMIYQSMSGDAEPGRSSFSMTGGRLVSNNGDMMYVTNTKCDIFLSQVELVPSNNMILVVAGNNTERGWGRSGENGGDAVCVLQQQQLQGDILVDDISQLDIRITQQSEFNGSINTDGAQGSVSVLLDENSSWMLSGDSFIDSIQGIDRVNTNGHKLYVAGQLVDF